MRTLTSALLPVFVFGLLMSIFSCAQAPITDVGIQDGGQSASDDGGSTADAAAAYSSSGAIGLGDGNGVVSNIDNASLYRKIEQMEEEIRSLRGLVEEQSHQIKQQSKQQPNGAAVADYPEGGSGGAVVAETPVAVDAPLEADGKSDYKAAYAKLKAKDYDGALAGFEAITKKFPGSDYAGSSMYWLGFVYQTKGNTASATRYFSSLIERFPRHVRAPDAKYNLGKIYNSQGDKAKARALLKEVATGNSKIAPLAKQYLDSI